MSYALFLYQFLGKEGKNIMICETCNIPMKPVMSFSKEKYEKFDRCPKCFGETKHVKLRDDQLIFGEVFYKELKK